MKIRFLVCIDTEGETLADAYIHLYKIMNQKFPASHISWESSDEAYDEEGDLLSCYQVQEARFAGLAKMQEERKIKKRKKK